MDCNYFFSVDKIFPKVNAKAFPKVLLWIFEVCILITSKGVTV